MSLTIQNTPSGQLRIKNNQKIQSLKSKNEVSERAIQTEFQKKVKNLH